MFRKVNKFLKKNTGNNSSSPSSSLQDKMQQLESMGFDKTQAANALEATNGDLEQATNHLLTNQSVLEQQQQQNGHPSQRQSQQHQNQNQNRQNQHRSAASIRAGQAAASRFEDRANSKFAPKKKKPTRTQKLGKLQPQTEQQQPYKAHHPNVKMPPKLSSKTKEEQILRCANRLAPHPSAVDTLLNAFTFIQNHPDNDKYRKIDPTSAGYRNTLEGVPGALDLIHAMNFVERGGGDSNRKDIVLIREKVDPALLFLGISALEKTRETKEYVERKLQIKFEKDVRGILDGRHSDEEFEIIKRADYLSKVPSEPSDGAGALMQVNIGSQKFSRRFDGDDVLQDVIHWMGVHASVIPNKILSREWSLVDLNRYPLVPMDVEGNMDRTLQFIGCWPSGILEIRASSEEWKSGKENGETMGSSRGLGAAPSSVVN
jgi:hypothetical protein